MKDEIDDLIINFQPLEALLILSRMELEAHNLLVKTVDRTVIARKALRLPGISFEHVLRFISAANRFQNDNQFKEQLLCEQMSILESATKDPETVSEVNRIVIAGDLRLQEDLQIILRETFDAWISEIKTHLQQRSISSSQEERFGDILREKIKNLDSEDRSIFHYKASDLKSDKYLVYYMDLKEILTMSVKFTSGYLKDVDKEKEQDILERVIETIQNQTSLMSPSWRTSVKCDVHLDQYVCNRAMSQVLDILILQSSEGELQPRWNLLETIRLYNDAKKNLDKAKDNKWWELAIEYKTRVFTARLSEAPLVPEVRNAFTSALQEAITEELSNESFTHLDCLNIFDIVGSLSIQHTSAPMLSDISIDYADLTCPWWGSAMAVYPWLSINNLLSQVVSAVISGSVSAYVAWRLSKLRGKHPSKSVKTKLSYRENSATECTRLLDIALEKMLRYQFHLFESHDARLASKSVDEILVQFSEISSKIKELHNPELSADIAGLTSLFSNELNILSEQDSTRDIIPSIIDGRRLFCRKIEVMKVIANKADAILIEHVRINAWYYDRTDSLEVELSRAEQMKREAKVSSIAKIASNQLIINNSPYILTLSIRHFLAGFKEPTHK